MLYCDNKAVMGIANNPIHHGRTKHIEIDRHFNKEKLNEGIICIIFVKSSDQLADIFRKEVASKVFDFIVNKLRMINIYLNLRGSVKEKGC